MRAEGRRLLLPGCKFGSISRGSSCFSPVFDGEEGARCFYGSFMGDREFDFEECAQADGVVGLFTPGKSFVPYVNYDSRGEGQGMQ